MEKTKQEKEWDELPKMTKQDLDIYLDVLDKDMVHYRAQQIIKPNIYNFKMIKKLDKMAVEAIARFHYQNI